MDLDGWVDGRVTSPRIGPMDSVQVGKAVWVFFLAWHCVTCDSCMIIFTRNDFDSLNQSQNHSHCQSSNSNCKLTHVEKDEKIMCHIWRAHPGIAQLWIPPMATFHLIIPCLKCIGRRGQWSFQISHLVESLDSIFWCTFATCKAV